YRRRPGRDKGDGRRHLGDDPRENTPQPPARRRPRRLRRLRSSGVGTVLLVAHGRPAVSPAETTMNTRPYFGRVFRYLRCSVASGEGGIRTHEAPSDTYSLSRTARSTTPAPLLELP